MMKSIRKKYLIPFIFIIIIVAFAGLVGCGKKDDGGNNGGSSVTRYYVTIMDGNSVYDREYIYDESGNVFAVPKKSGNKFLGFYTADDACFFDSNGYQTELLITEDIVLYCKWEALTCTFNFDSDGGALSSSNRTAQYAYGDELRVFPVPEKTGYDFKGWMNGNNIVTDGYGNVLSSYSEFTSNNYVFSTSTTVEFKAVYSIKQLYVTFDYRDYVYDAEQLPYEYGTPFADMVMPEKDTGSKVIVGWSTDPNQMQTPNGNIYSDTILYAIWKDYRAVTIYITTTKTEKIKVFTDTEYTTESEREGYTFKGWYTTSDLTGTPKYSISYSDGESKYYCKWEIINYYVQLLNKDGSVYQGLNYNVETDGDLPVLDDENGLEFLGWCKKSDLSDTPITKTDDIGGATYLYPKWRDYTTVYVHLSNTKTREQTVKYGENYSLGVAEYSYTDKMFAYWYINGTNGSRIALTDKNGDSLKKWDRTDKVIDVYSYYETYSTVTISCSYPDGSTKQFSTERYFVGEKITLTNPDTKYSVKGYYVNGNLISSEQTTTYTVTSTDANVIVKLTSAEAALSEAFGYNVYKYNEHYYSFISKPSTWDDAQAFCETFGGHLATITSAEENTWVVNTAISEFTTPSNIWLGATDVDTEGTWKWITGENFSYTNWASGEPNGRTNENHLQLYGSLNYKWNDAVSSSASYFVCEWDSKSFMHLPTTYKLAFNDGTTDNLVRVFTNGNSKYALIDRAVSWTEAEKLCEYIGGHLAVITSSGEQEYVLTLNEYFGGGANRWLGASDYKTEGTFKTVTGETLSYTNWHTNQPDNYNNEDYLMINGSASNSSSAVGTWNDAVNNSTTIKIICEWNTGDTIGVTKYGNFHVKVTTAADMANINLAGQEWGGGADVLLANDIDMKGVSWTITDFYGVFNGGGHKISNLSISSTTAYTGVFATVTGTIENVNFEKLTLISSYNSSSTSSYCGLVAYLNGGTIDGVNIVSGNIYANWSETGGIVGCVTKTSTVKNCENHANVTCTNTSTSYDKAGTTGGIVGWAPEGLTIENCKNYGTITGTYEVGGIVGGSNAAMTFTKFINQGEINGTAYVGGIIGCGRKAVTIDGCSSSGSITATNNYGKYVGTTNVTYQNLAAINITKVADLEKMKLNVSDETINLKANLDLGGYTWTMVDVLGTFNGNDYKLSNISISGANGNVGVFGTVKGTVKNVTFENVSIISNSNDYSGCGVIAYLDGGTVSNVVVNSGSIHATWACTGGVVGWATNSAKITNCVNRASVTVQNSATGVASNGANGGIVGWIPSAIIIETCSNYGDVTGTYEVGGIIGASNASLVLTNMVNEGAISGTAYVGGIVGNANTKYTVSVDGCTSIGAITATSNYSKYVGGGNATYSNLPTIELSTKEDLQLLKGNVKEETFVLTNNIDLAGMDWITIDLKCTLDGKGFKLSNINVTGNVERVGVFGTVTGMLKNVTFANVSITSNYSKSAYCGLIAYLDGGTADSITFASGSVQAAWAAAGGIVGCATNGAKISNCINKASVILNNTATSLSDFCGNAGIVGWVPKAIIIERCENYGEIIGTYKVGGIVGVSDTTLALIDMANYGDVSGVDYVGGLVGCGTTNYKVTVNNCTSLGKVKATGGTNYSKYVGAGSATYVDLPSVSISNAAELYQLNGNVTPETYVLTDDVYMSGLLWETIDVNCTIEGNGHTIYNMVISSDAEKVGVFGTVKGTIRNLKFSNLTITSTCSEKNSYCGVVAYLDAGTVDNVKVLSGNISANFACMGGIVGAATNNATITNCSNAAELTLNNIPTTSVYYGALGGIVGFVPGTIIVTGCENSGAVNGAYFAGGVIGKTDATLILANMTNTAPVTGVDYLGGLVGNVSSGNKVTIDSCMFKGKVTSTSDTAANVGKYVGSGTATYNNLAKIEIASAQDLDLLRGSIDQEMFELTADIDLSGIEWVPVHNFGATLDGKGHTISNLTCSREYDEGPIYMAGMFGLVKGTVKNLKFEDLTILWNGEDDGSILGCCGVVAYLSGGTVDGIEVLSGSISAKYANTGSIVGAAAYSAKVINCINHASVTVTNAAVNSDYNGSCGGIVGSNSASTSISKCTNYGAVTGTYKVGGVIGVSEYGIVLNNIVNEGSVTGKEYVGGIVGTIGTVGEVAFNSCASKGKITANDNWGKYVGVGSANYSAIPTIEIKSVDDIYLLEGNVMQESYVLTGDIDMTGVTWTPIDLKASLDGGNFKIKNLEISSSEPESLALFIEVSSTLKNLTFENVTVINNSNMNASGADLPQLAIVCVTLTGTMQNVTIASGSVTSSYGQAGSMVAYVNGGTIENCINYANVTTSSDSELSYTGGIAGKVVSGTITGCENRGKVTGGTHTAGIVGHAVSSTLSNCTNYGEVSGSSYAAGVVGEFETSTSLITATNYGAVTATGDYAAGICAKFTGEGTIGFTSGFANNGKVTAAGNYVGGIFGYFVSYINTGNAGGAYTVTLAEMSNTTAAISGVDYVGGLIGYIKVYAENNGSYTSQTKLSAVSGMFNSGNVTGKTYVGGLFGYGYSNNNKSVLTGDAYAKVTGDSIVGGIAGKLENIILKDCSNLNSTVTANSYVEVDGEKFAYLGGYVGIGYAVEGCVNAVNITYTSEGQCVGGIAGLLVNGYATNCRNRGTIIAANANYVGGIFGKTVTNVNVDYNTLINTGAVQGADYVGGIIGHATSVNTSTISYCSSTGTVTGSGSNVGNIIGKAENVSILS